MEVDANKVYKIYFYKTLQSRQHLEDKGIIAESEPCLCHTACKTVEVTHLPSHVNVMYEESVFWKLWEAF